jgi:hypothetical protein
VSVLSIAKSAYSLSQEAFNRHGWVDAEATTQIHGEVREHWEIERWKAEDAFLADDSEFSD